VDFPSLLAAADSAALAVLGGTVRYASATTGGTVDVRGVFDNADANATVQGQEVISSGPRVFLRLVDLPADPEGEPKGYPQVTVGGVTYSARDVVKDGQGGVLLLLSEAV
jgi:tetrahydromethanopterin S-methyltransferase subunit H